MYLFRNLSRKDKRLVLVLATANLIISIGLLMVFRQPNTEPTEPAPDIQVARLSASDGNPRPVPPVQTESSTETTLSLDSLINRIATGSPSDRLETWDAFRNTLLAEPEDDAVACIETFLSSGVSVATGLDFTLAEGGVLVAAPDLRTLLLDLLDTIDPIAARSAAREILQVPDRPDDWAISLRIVSRSTEPNDAWLIGRVGTLLSMDDWAEAPTTAYLQAFDAAVYVDSKRVTRRLLELTDMSKPRATRQAARRALNRKANADFAAVGALIAVSETLADDPGTRAALMARADVRIAADRRILETYLAGLDPVGPEARAFAAQFPNHNMVVSDNLIPSDPPTPIPDRIEQDRATIAWITGQRNNPLFARILPVLDRIERRLAGYIVESSSEPGEHRSIIQH